MVSGGRDRDSFSYQMSPLSYDRNNSPISLPYENTSSLSLSYYDPLSPTDLPTRNAHSTNNSLRQRSTSNDVIHWSSNDFRPISNDSCLISMDARSTSDDTHLMSDNRWTSVDNGCGMNLCTVKNRSHSQNNCSATVRQGASQSLCTCCVPRDVDTSCTMPGLLRINELGESVTRSERVIRPLGEGLMRPLSESETRSSSEGLTRLSDEVLARLSDEGLTCPSMSSLTSSTTWNNREQRGTSSFPCCTSVPRAVIGYVDHHSSGANHHGGRADHDFGIRTNYHAAKKDLTTRRHHVSVDEDFQSSGISFSHVANTPTRRVSYDDTRLHDAVGFFDRSGKIYYFDSSDRTCDNRRDVPVSPASCCTCACTERSSARSADLTSTERNEDDNVYTNDVSLITMSTEGDMSNSVTSSSVDAAAAIIKIESPSPQDLVMADTGANTPSPFAATELFDNDAANKQSRKRVYLDVDNNSSSDDYRKCAKLANSANKEFVRGLIDQGKAEVTTKRCHLLKDVIHDMVDAHMRTCRYTKENIAASLVLYEKSMADLPEVSKPASLLDISYTLIAIISSLISRLLNY